MLGTQTETSSSSIPLEADVRRHSVDASGMGTNSRIAINSGSRMIMNSLASSFSSPRSGAQPAMC